MNRYKDFCNKLYKIVQSENVAVDEPMKNHTSFKVGGPVDILVTPESYDEIVKVIKLCNEENMTYYIIGRGSNLIVRDGGFRGMVIKLTKLDKIKVEDERLIVQSGVDLCKVSEAALENSLKGFEFACGIPGTVGGAVTMNAGAYNGEISQVIESALVVDKNGKLITLNKEELELGYRMSAIQKYGYTVLEVTFKLIKGEYSSIKERIDDLTKKREDKQPLEYPSAGSTFKRPEGHYTGKLIEESKLKGFSIGGAQVSEKHAGFIINKGDATAKDILDLIAYIQNTIKSNFDVELHPEVRIIGED
ncbi:UDP-N-acetylmuramate dehydrogenase [Clostridium sp. YIM B02515]|uniref:UDP-N-acetylenolpyruvoylglucosamine reductase n=1 Tax=Clostridium rhizosphaerae TaxID=2803861 RepID=A0ABS1TE88_9CLOT|nr:UDP-N-acetylmuramate dehydrogenase [Clostridium rhizosphaerae]MBL4936293.1 UDP-N-acetylmuramate dehydrogenase [Clostridium rhizosphaerae]